MDHEPDGIYKLEEHFPLTPTQLSNDIETEIENDLDILSTKYQLEIENLTPLIPPPEND